MSGRLLAPVTTIVEQRINGFLQHAFFVAHDDVRRTQLNQALQAVIPVDHTAIQIVQIRCCETAAIERNQRTQLRWDDRDHIEDHPFRTRAGFDERLDDFQALHILLALGLGVRLLEVNAQPCALALKIDRHQHILEGLGADLGGEGLVAEFFLFFEIVLFRQERVLLQIGQTGFRDDVILKVEHPLEITQRVVEQHADPARQRLQEPDMRNRRRQFDMAHPLAANRLKRDFNTALLADNAAILHALVLAAQTLVILDRAKDPGAEQTITFRLECPVVDRFRLLDLSI